MAGMDARRRPSFAAERSLWIAILLTLSLAVSSFAQAPNARKQRTVAGPATPPAASADAATVQSIAAEKAAGQTKIAAVINGEPITRQELADESLRRHADDAIEAVVNKHL